MSVRKQYVSSDLVHFVATVDIEAAMFIVEVFQDFEDRRLLVAVL